MISKDVSDKIEKSNNSPAGSRKVIAICSIRFYKDFFTEVTWNSSLYNQQPWLVDRVLGSIKWSSQFISYDFRLLSGSLSDEIGKR